MESTVGAAGERTHSRRRVGSYPDAIYWIAVNDDTLWLEDEESGSPSVTLCLVADIFGRTVEEATADLRRAIASEERRAERTRRALVALDQVRQNVRAAIAKVTGAA